MRSMINRDGWVDGAFQPRQSAVCWSSTRVPTSWSPHIAGESKSTRFTFLGSDWSGASLLPAAHWLLAGECQLWNVLNGNCERKCLECYEFGILGMPIREPAIQRELNHHLVVENSQATTRLPNYNNNIRNIFKLPMK